MGGWACRVLVLLVCARVRALLPACKLQTLKLNSFVRDGDLILGGVLLVHSEYTSPELTFKEVPQPISCKGFTIRYYRDLLAMLFAIEEINRTPDLLPNITLGFRIFDTCASQNRALQGLLEELSGKSDPMPGYNCNLKSIPVGLLGEVLSSTSISLARISGPLHFPVISYGSLLSTLSDKTQFPSFLRTVPSNTFQMPALAQLMRFFGWTWIGLIISDDELGMLGGQSLKRLIEKNEGCVAFMEKIHLSYSTAKLAKVIEIAKRHTVKVIIVHSPEVHMKKVMEVFFALNVMDKVFVFSASFTFSHALFPRNTWTLFNGSLILNLHFSQMPGFEWFLTNLNPLQDSNIEFIKLFWEEAFNCKWPGSNTTEIMTEMENSGIQVSCSENQTLHKMAAFLFEFNDLSVSYHIYQAVYALAHAMNSLISCKPGQGPFSNSGCADINNFQPWQVLHYVKNINVTLDIGGDIHFDVNGDPLSDFDIANLQVFDGDDIQLINVGFYRSQQGEEVHVNTKNILWADNNQIPRSVCREECLPGYRRTGIEGQPVCCFDCVPCAQGEISVTGRDECMKCPDDKWSNENHDHCIQKVTEFLSFEEPLGLTLTIFAVFLTLITSLVLGVFIKYRDTPIVKANNRGLSYLLLASLMLCFLCSIIFVCRPQKLTCMLRQTVFGVIFSVSVASVLAKTIVVVIVFKATNPSSSARKWLGSKTPTCIVFVSSLIQIVICVVWLVKSPPFAELNMVSYKEKLIVQCNEGGAIFFYCMLGYMGLLATVSFVVAFVSRNLPGSFNEAKLITFSMLVFVSVWLSFLPAYLSTRGKYMVAVEVFAILCSSAGLLGCIFFPKCYIILRRPEINTRHNLIGYHMYVDDTQLYIKVTLTEHIKTMNQALTRIRQWLTLNHLKLNPQKTEFLLITPQKSTFKLAEWSNIITALNCTPKIVYSTKYLGITLDKNLNMIAHINTMAKNTSYLPKLKPFLNKTDLKTAVQALVISRIEYGCTTLAGLPKVTTAP
ncbi:extracellular calcium-sensing receptor-like [Lissotriton helveticus]